MEHERVTIIDDVIVETRGGVLRVLVGVEEM